MTFIMRLYDLLSTCRVYSSINSNSPMNKKKTLELNHLFNIGKITYFVFIFRYFVFKSLYSESILWHFIFQKSFTSENVLFQPY